MPGPRYDRAKVMEEIFRRMAEGETVRAICRDKHMPDRVTLWGWLDSDADLSSRYARAREMQGHAVADMAIERGLQRTDNPQADRLEFDALRWMAGKVAPRHYGDKTVVTGPNDGPVQVESRVIDAAALSVEDREALRAVLIAAQQK